MHRGGEPTEASITTFAIGRVGLWEVGGVHGDYRRYVMFVVCMSPPICIRGLLPTIHRFYASRRSATAAFFYYCFTGQNRATQNFVVLVSENRLRLARLVEAPTPTGPRGCLG